MNITLIGCGSLGRVFLYLLDKHCCNINIITKNDYKNNFLESTVCTINGDVYSKKFITNSIDKLKTSDLILLTVKANNVTQIIKNLASKVSLFCPIVIICNGMGIEEELKTIKQPIIRGITNHAAFTDDDITFHKHHGIITIGPVNEAGKSCKIIADRLNELMGPVEWEPNIQAACWNKLAVNCVINPLTVKYDCLNGNLLIHKKEIVNICTEIYEVMKKFIPIKGVSHLVSHILEMIYLTSKNSSSMRQDIIKKKKTEIEYMNGFILRCASQLNITLPFNDALYKLVILKEQTYLNEGI